MSMIDGPSVGESAPQQSELVAFEVEGSGHFLVPLWSLARYRVPVATASTSGVALGWGWTLLVVRWNAFHVSQIETRIQLAPGVVATLTSDHFREAIGAG